MRFLIVDDNEDFRKYLIKNILKDNNEIYELDDGINVNEVYNEFRPDLVIMDIKMKYVNGFAAAQKLKSEFPLSRIIIVSDYADIKYKTKAASVGAEALISKENLLQLENIINKELISE